MDGMNRRTGGRRGRRATEGGRKEWSVRGRRHGFTFVEIMIVLAIIAVLAAIAVPNFLEAQTRSLVARGKVELGLLKATLDSYRIEHRSYPANRAGGEANGWDLAQLTTPVPYLARVPMDVFTLEESSRGFTVEPYRYLLTEAEGGLEFEGAPGIMYRPDGLTVGLLWSYGADSRMSQEPLSDTEVTSGGAVVLGIEYNPTNGTTSRGDIYARFP